MTSDPLTRLGWSAHFAAAQTALGPEAAALQPMRVAELHRDRVQAMGAAGSVSLIPSEIVSAYAVGDWVLSDGTSALHRLPPLTDLVRRAAGHEAVTQRIAANIDTIAIVSSFNADFNLARLERYLSLVLSSGAMPLIVLTRADQIDDPFPLLREAEALSPLATAMALNAKDLQDAERLRPWCKDGQTLALVGSSGVGKTTLRNALCGDAAETAGIRADDAKGRHTTTFRALRPTRAGGWLIDTPGMRELQLAEAEDGLAALFDDIEARAALCRFRDCAHDREPGCAVQAAIAAGEIAPDRLERWRKLRAEDARNSQDLRSQRRGDRRFGRMVREATKHKKARLDPDG